MAFVTLNNYDVEHASSLLVYENLIQEIVHINGKGCVDTYTPTKDVESVTYIDVMRILPFAPQFRQLGATNNGTWHNQLNEGGYKNAPQSTHYTVSVDLIYDTGVPITSWQTYSNPVALKAVVTEQIIKTAGMSINVVTFAKQIEGFFRDSFSEEPTADELADSVFNYDDATAATQAGSASDAFIAANAQLTDGIPTLGALFVPLERRQAFISSQMNRIMKRQYEQNASEAAARINSSGFINPWTNTESTRINAATGLCGTYDGVDMFLFNKSIREFVYVAINCSRTGSNSAVATLLDQMQGMIIYADGTCRGIVGPTVEANPNPYYGGVYILPKLKMGVDVLDGRSIKLITNGTAWTTANITTIKTAVKFTPIDGKSVTAANVLGEGVFNDGTSS